MRVFKRTLCLFLAVLMLTSVLFAVPVSAATVESGTCGENLKWKLDDKGVLTISGQGRMYDYDTFPSDAPWAQHTFNSVIIEDGVTYIGYGAFWDCKLTSATISGTVTEIGRSAFELCENLKSVTILEGVTSIGSDAFNDCGIESITIPGSVNQIGSNAFADCSSLSAISVDPANTVYSSVDGILYNKDKTELIRCPGGKSGSVTIPEGVTSIWDYAFKNCSVMTSVKIPDSVTVIGGGAFYGCSALKSVKIPEGVTEIADSTFDECLALVSVTIPEGVTTIGYSAFWGCSSLVSISIPESVTSIYERAFMNCDSLTSLTIPKNVASISSSAFCGSTNIEKITVAENNAFYTCIDGILYDKKMSAVILAPVTTTGSVTIPDGVTVIKEFAFEGCTGLTSISIPSSVTNIEMSAFEGCTSLSSVTIPKNVAKISWSVFNNCTALKTIDADPANTHYASVDGILYTKDKTQLVWFPAAKSGSVTIPASVEEIQWDSFEACHSLTEIYVEDGSAAYASVDGILFNKELTSLIVCPAAKSGSVTIPKTVTEISYNAFEACSKLTEFKVASSNTAYTAVDGVLFNKELTYLISCPAAKSGSVTIPASVEQIQWSAFQSCHSLTAIYVEDGNTVYTSIGGVLYEKAFYNIIAYPTLNTEPVTIASGVRYISSDIFSGNTSLTSIKIPDTVTSIAYAAFEGCTNLGSVNIPVDVKTISRAFKDCTSLPSITIPASITGIFYYAFENCTALKEIIFEGSAPGMAQGIFNGVTATAYYNDADPTWTKAVRKDYGGNITWKAYKKGEEPWKTSPEITKQPKTQYVELGEKAKFTVKASGESLKYQWYYKDVDGSKYKKCSGTKATYSLEMTEARKDRKLYCVVTDKYGNEVKTKTVYMRMAASIKTEPKTQYEQLGDKAKFTVKAVGDGLKYQWYYKSAGSSKYKKASSTKSSYTITMTEDRKDRAFYCLITDKYGNEVKSKTVTMKMTASIKTEPKSVKTSIGKKANFTVKAVGDGLTYQWYYKDTDSSKYKKASCTKAAYSIELTKARNGRKFYCVVTDKYGNEVKTKTVSMKKK